MGVYNNRQMNKIVAKAEKTYILHVRRSSLNSYGRTPLVKKTEKEIAKACRTTIIYMNHISPQTYGIGMRLSVPRVNEALLTFCSMLMLC